MSFENFVELNQDVELEQFLESVKKDGLFEMKLDDVTYDKLAEAISSGYKRGSIQGSDTEEIKNLNKEMKKAETEKKSVGEYSKKSLLAIADMTDLIVNAKFKKANGEIRSGKFQIMGSKSQRTAKEGTIVVKDLDIDQYRTIPLDRLVSIQPV